MNDENNEPVEEVTPVTEAGDDLAVSLTAGLPVGRNIADDIGIATLQGEVDNLTAALVESEERVGALEAERDATPLSVVTPVGDADLRALAATVRTAQRSGHPDAGKHLDTLLTALGAV